MFILDLKFVIMTLLLSKELFLFSMRVVAQYFIHNTAAKPRYQSQYT